MQKKSKERELTKEEINELIEMLGARLTEAKAFLARYTNTRETKQ